MTECDIPQKSSENEFLLELMSEPNCTLHFVRDGLPRGRMCFSSIISVCSSFYLAKLSKLDRERIQNACELGPFIPVTTTLDDKQFRNIHCMECQDNSSSENAMCGVFPPFKEFIPLRAILNVSFATQTKKPSQQCPQGAIFDFVMVSMFSASQANSIGIFSKPPCLIL